MKDYIMRYNIDVSKNFPYMIHSIVTSTGEEYSVNETVVFSNNDDATSIIENDIRTYMFAYYSLKLLIDDAMDLFTYAHVSRNNCSYDVNGNYIKAAYPPIIINFYIHNIRLSAELYEKILMIEGVSTMKYISSDTSFEILLYVYDEHHRINNLDKIEYECYSLLKEYMRF